MHVHLLIKMPSTVGDSETEHNLNDLDEVLRRHRKEKKDLRKKIMSLKGGVDKKDKKGMRKAAEEMETLEKSMTERHEKEIDALKEGSCDAVTPEHEMNQMQIKKGISKAQRRRDKKMEIEQKFLLAEKEDEVRSSLSEGRLEMESISKILNARGLMIHDVASDGDCLYNAIAYCLSSTDKNVSGKEMRKIAADFIRSNKDDFLPFLSDESGDPIDEHSFDDYSNGVEKSCYEGGRWGGATEIRALSCALKKRVEIIHQEGNYAVFGEQYNEKPIIISYHRYTYSLGEHFNSTDIL